MPKLSIRQEIQSDHETVGEIIRSAFNSSELGHNGEAELVSRLRNSKSFIPKLTLVATVGNEIVGHILLTRIQIVRTSRKIPALALAPISVLPEFQNKGVGAALIFAAHVIAKDLNERYIVLLGHQDYYPRFGYEQCKTYELKLPFPAPDENCMIYKIDSKDSENISGMVEYDPAFME